VIYWKKKRLASWLKWVVYKPNKGSTKNKGQEMAFAKIEDDSGSIEVVVFPKIYSQTKQCWGKDRVVFIEGKVQTREGNRNIIVEKATLIEEENLTKEEKEAPKRDLDFEIEIPSRATPRKLVEINKILKQSQGKDKVGLIFVDSQGRRKRMALPFGIKYSRELKEEINKIIEE